MSKRGQNEGSIFEERPGRWVALLTLGYEIVEGKRRRIRKKFTGPTKRKVQRKLNEALGKQDRCEPVERGRTPFGTILNRWMSEVATRKLQPSTLASYESLIKNHIAPELGSVVLTELHADTIDRFMAKKQEQGLSPRSVQYCHAIVRRALRQAQKWRMISYNAARDATPPASDPHEVQPFTPEQAIRFLGAVQGDRMEAFYNVALAIGLRRGEALGLQWGDIDFDTRMVTVRRSLQRNKRKLMLIPWTKNKKVRTIALPRFAVDRLLSHRDQQEQERLFAGEKWAGNDLVFTTRKGTPVEPRNALRHFQSLLEVIGLPHHRLHDLRHTAASLLLAQGATLHEVMQTLGHSQITLTANLYGHMYDAARRQNADRMDAVLNPVAPSVAPSGSISKPN